MPLHCAVCKQATGTEAEVLRVPKRVPRNAFLEAAGSFTICFGAEPKNRAGNPKMLCNSGREPRTSFSRKAAGQAAALEFKIEQHHPAEIPTNS